MGFLDNKKSPDYSNDFLFRQESLTAIKYSLFHFSQENKCYYPNLFYIEGMEGLGKRLLVDELINSCKQKSFGNNLVEVFIDCKYTPVSKVTGIVNLLYQIRKSIEKSQTVLGKAFVKFDEAYEAFLNGTLTEDIGEEKLSKEEIKKQTDKKNTNNKALDAKAKLALMRNKGKGGVQKKITSKLDEDKILSEISNFHNKTNPKRQSNQMKLASTNTVNAYAPFVPLEEKQMPRMKDGEPDIKAIASSLTNAVEGLKKTNIKNVDYNSILLKKFIQAFGAICKHRKIVLIFDNFEKVEPLYNFIFSGLFKNIPTEFIAVICGQLDLEKQLKQRYNNNLMYIFLPYFSFYQVEEYLLKNGALAESSVVETVHTLTKGHPCAVALLASILKTYNKDVFKIMKFLEVTEGEDEDELKEDYVRYSNTITLDHISQKDRKIIILLAIMRDFDKNLIEHIAGVFNATDLIKSLMKKYSFLREYGLPDMLKKYTRTYAKHDIPVLFEEIHRLSFDYFSEELDKKPENKDLWIDILYHQFKMDEDKAYTNLLSIMSFYISNDVIFCEKLIHGLLTAGISKLMRDKLSNIKESIPYFILKDHKKTLPLMEAISELQRNQPNEFQVLDF